MLLVSIQFISSSIPLLTALTLTHISLQQGQPETGFKLRSLHAYPDMVYRKWVLTLYLSFLNSSNYRYIDCKSNFIKFWIPL